MCWDWETLSTQRNAALSTAIHSCYFTESFRIFSAKSTLGKSQQEIEIGVYMLGTEATSKDLRIDFGS